MAQFGTFEGIEVLLGKLKLNGFEVPVEDVLHQHDEVYVIARVKIGEIAFPPTDDAPSRVHRATVARRKDRPPLAVVLAGDTLHCSVPNDETGEVDVVTVAQWLEDACDTRDGLARLSNDGEGPDWLAEDPVETTEVEMGDGPAKTKRRKRDTGVTAEEAGLPDGVGTGSSA